MESSSAPNLDTLLVALARAPVEQVENAGEEYHESADPPQADAYEVRPRAGDQQADYRYHIRI